MITANKYWKHKRSRGRGSCSNVSLFRFIGQYGFKFKNKKVLEIGFGDGADLIEFKRRNSKVYGLDINLEFAGTLKKIIGKSNIKENDSGKETIPFQIKFDLIYSRDFIYYLSKKEMIFHINNVHKSLKKNGLFVFHFIEKDLVIKKKLKKQYNFEKNYVLKKFSEPNNPIKFYDKAFFKEILDDVDFKILGTKFVIESFGIKEKKVRINKYILCTN